MLSLATNDGAAPKSADAVMHDGQEFIATGSKPYRTKDGRDVAIITWSSECVTCGASFTFERSNASDLRPTRRCPLHRNWMLKVARERKLRAAAARQEPSG